MLAALSMVSPFSIDTFFPSFHAIAADFGLSKWAVQQTLTVYMLPLSIMSLVQGPLSDALGRRPIILTGLCVYTLASVGCTFAPNFTTLLIFRALQGISAGVGMIVGRAVIRDLFEGPQAQKLLSLVTMLFAFAPAVAPVIGGWIHVTLGWHAVFGFMALFGTALVLGAHLMLPETHPKEKRSPLHAGTLARTAWSIVRHREFLLLATAMGANFAALMSFVGAAPSVVVDHWHLRETQFAYLFIPVIGGLISSAFISGRMAGRYTYAQQSHLGFLLALGGSALMTLLFVLVTAPPIIIQQLLIAVIAFGVQLAGPTLSLRMLDLFPRARGSAASVQSCVSIAISALIFGLVSPILSGSMLSLAEGSFCSALIAFGLWRLSQHGLRHTF
ncbi:MAG: transporter, family, multidrug resistance protein [Gammaproteobacteria bacterium]|nr:transporter, family, multidrug resistance protein [Gammaproteobacteria bacterium]